MDSGPLPPGWERKYHPGTGRYYYLNHSTRQTQWTDPRETASSSSWTESARPAAQPVAAPSSALPAGWEAKLDPRTQRYYYLNHITKETTWVKPTTASQPSYAPQPTVQETPKEQAVNEKNLGNEAYKNQQYTVAIQHYQKAISLDSTEIAFYNNLSAAYFELKEYEQCVTSCLKAVSVGSANGAPSNSLARSYGRMGKAYRRMGDLSAAQNSFEKAIEENWTEEYDAELNEIKEELADDEWEDEEEEETDEEKALKENKLGVEAFNSRDYRTAISYYDQAINLNNTNMTFYNNKAQAYLGLKQYQECKDVCDLALSIGLEEDSSLKASLLGRMGQAHNGMGDLKMALAYFKQSVEENFSLEFSDELERVKAQIEEQERLWRESQKTPEEKAIEQKNLGNEAYKNHDYRTAISHYQKAITLDNNEIAFHNNLAAAYFQLKEYQECVRSCEMALSVGKANHAESRSLSLSLGRMGRAYRCLGNLPAAQRSLKKAIEEQSNEEYEQELKKVEDMLAEEEEKKKGEQYIGMLKTMFPSAQEQILQDVLRNCGNNMGQAASRLATMGYKSSIASHQSPPKPQSTPQRDVAPQRSSTPQRTSTPQATSATHQRDATPQREQTSVPAPPPKRIAAPARPAKPQQKPKKSAKPKSKTQWKGRASVAKGPDGSLKNGPNVDLLRDVENLAVGPNSSLRQGPNSTLVNGPTPSAKGPNQELFKGPDALIARGPQGLAKGSLLATCA